MGLELFAAAGGVVVVVSIVGLGFLVSKRLGAAEAQKHERESNLETQRKLAAILARRDRTKRELIEWMRHQAND